MIDTSARLGGTNTIVVSPDAGGVERARAFAKRLNVPLAIIDKRREQANVAEVMNIIGDVAGKHCLMVDDLIDTAGTLVKGSEALLAAGRGSCLGLCDARCAVRAGGRANRGIAAARSRRDQLDTAEERSQKNATRFGLLSVAPLLARAIQSIHEGGSVSTLFV